MTDDAQSFLALPVHHVQVDGGALAYRELGEGPPLLLVHGWPLWGFTWRHMLPVLAAQHRCVVVDLLGAGESRWDRETDVGLAAQARALARLLTKLEIEGAAVVAHDTGATIARQLALIAPARVGALVLIDTEIPNHRPPLVQAFQLLAALPGAARLFGRGLRSPALVRSSLGFGGCFDDRDLVQGDFGEHIVSRLANDRRALEGQMAYARAIDWDLIDSLAEGHRRIHQKTLLLWGERDPFFPIDRAREMVEQFPNCEGLEAFPGRLFIQEERALRVAQRTLRFLKA